jgi:hypothetical protein
VFNGGTLVDGAGDVGDRSFSRLFRISAGVKMGPPIIGGSCGAEEPLRGGGSSGCGGYVGDCCCDFGVPRMSFFIENFRDKLLAD